ncbi:MAG: LptA/OstA family protein [Desulfosudaceae bacterium]
MNHNLMRPGLLSVLILALGLAAAPAVTVAADAAGSSGQSRDENGDSRVRITSDKLETRSGDDRQAVFSGNVRAIGEDFAITADKLVVFYTADTTGENNDASLNETFNKIIATGNVTIKSGERIAKSEKAVYDKNKKTIVLTGQNARVTGESGRISGEKIIMHTVSEAVTVESSSGQRVEAVIESHSTENNSR